MAGAGLRRRRVEEEGESVFVSMTDLTVSFLFILLVLLAFFATQFQPEDMVARSEYEALDQQLSEANDTKRELEEALANERQRLDRLEQERRVLADRLAEAGRTITELRALVDALRAELAVATAAIDVLSARLDALQRDLESMRTERDDARARVELLLAEVGQLSQSLADCRRERDRLRMQLAEMMDPDSLAAYLEDTSAARETLLERMADSIRQRLPGIQVTVDTSEKALPGRVVKSLFASQRIRSAVSPENTPLGRLEMSLSSRSRNSTWPSPSNTSGTVLRLLLSRSRRTRDGRSEKMPAGRSLRALSSRVSLSSAGSASKSPSLSVLTRREETSRAVISLRWVAVTSLQELTPAARAMASRTAAVRAHTPVVSLLTE